MIQSPETEQPHEAIGALKEQQIAEAEQDAVGMELRASLLASLTAR